MLRRSSPHSNPQRKGAILYVIVSLLMLFLVIGLCFVIYAEAQATSSRIYREASHYLADKYPTPEYMFGYALGEIIYDVPDDTGAFSSLRGHSLARNMYGWNYNQVAGTGNIQGVNNETPFNGLGRLHTTGTQVMNPFGADDYQLINFMYWSNDPAAIHFKRDPERVRGPAGFVAGNTPYNTSLGMYTGGYNAPYTYPDLNNVYLGAMRGDGTVLARSYWRGDDVGFRHPTWAAPQPTLHPNNRAWTDPTAASKHLKYRTLRPRPADQLMNTEPQTEAFVNFLLASNQIFPRPASAEGDVRNLPPGIGTHTYDSVWVDLGFPVVRLAATNRKVKPMFAILIVDLDGRVNMNLAGNVREALNPATQQAYHASNKGIGPWEINPRRLMQQTANPFPAPPNFPAFGSDQEYVDTFRGNVTAAGRYGQQAGVPVAYPPFVGPPTFPVPNASNISASIPSQFPPNYSQEDLDGSSYIGGTANRQQVQFPVPGSFLAFPTFPTHYQSGSIDERTYHPSLFNPFQLNRPPMTPLSGTIHNDRLLPISDMQALIAYTTPTTAASGPAPGNPPFAISPDTQNSALGQLWYDNIRRYPKLRNMITMLSMDLDRAGVVPGQPINPGPTFSSATSPYVLNPASPPNAARFPMATGTIFNNNTPASLLPNRTTMGTPGGDLRDNDWRSLLGDIGRMDVNRRLESYYLGNPPTPPAPGNRLDLTNAAIRAQVDKAVRDRTLLARDIFDRLRFATGAANPNNYTAADPGTSDPQYEALRYLAQLAANMVDYLDDDDFITPFNFLNGTQAWGWVYGTELPRLVINEAYAQIQNHPEDNFGYTQLNYSAGATSDPDTPASAMARPFMPSSPLPAGANPVATRPYRVNFWVELHNPHRADAMLSENGSARLQLTDPSANLGDRNVYKVIIRSQVDNATSMRAASNSLGTPNSSGMPPNIDVQVLDFEPEGAADPAQNTVLPANGAYGNQATNGITANQGYYVLGPSPAMTAARWQAAFPHDRAGGGTPPFQVTLPVKDQTVGGTPSRLYCEIPAADRAGTNAMVTAGSPAYEPMVVLQRLAHPLLPPQPNPAAPYYNPYVTVDYLERIPLGDSLLYDTTGRRDNMGGAPERRPLNGGANNRQVVGRRQPFRATDLAPQTPATTTSISNTFFCQNGTTTNGGAAGTTLDTPFEWLVHFDRKLINPLDLLYVSGHKPHELTQQFIPAGTGQITTQFATSATQRHQHLAPWGVPAARLYRALELLGVRSWMHGVPAGGRLPGKININTIWDDEVWRALADSYDTTPVNFFTQTQANNIWNTLKVQRTPGYVAGTISATNDRPIWSLTMPNPSGADMQYPNGAGTTPTVLSSGKDFAGTFTIPPVPAGQTPHPLMRDDLLRKLTNNITTRSNVFAVYVTTGFFFVRDDSAQPVKLGAEVDVQLRHKMFAIVDRTNLSMQEQLVGGNPRMQGDRPIYFPLEPVTMPAGTPETAVGFNTPTPASITTVVPAYSSGPNTLRVRDTIDHNSLEYTASTGEYFDIEVGKLLYLDVGNENLTITSGRMEVVRVTGVNVANNTITIVRAAGGPFQSTHYRGCRIATQRAGNPGPQVLPLDYDSPPYSNTVVPFRMILQ